MKEIKCEVFNCTNPASIKIIDSRTGVEFNTNKIVLVNNKEKRLCWTCFKEYKKSLGGE